MNKVIRNAFFILIALLILGALILSSQKGDFYHSASFLRGLQEHGLNFYDKDVAGGLYSNYTPGLYTLFGIAMIPGKIISQLLNIQECGVGMSGNCIIEILSLKLTIVSLALISVYLINITQGDRGEKKTEPGTRKVIFNAASLLLLPTVAYSWLFFGAYDGLGNFSAVIGSILLLKRVKLANQNKAVETILFIAGLILATLATSSKFFPLVIILGICIAFAENKRDALIVILVPIVVTISQVVAVGKLSGEPLAIITNKIDQRAPQLLYNPTVSIIIILLYIGWLVYLYRKTNERQSIGFMAALSIFSIGMPSILWHPQWQIYYGTILFFTILLIARSQLAKKLLIIILSIQAISFLISVQWWGLNADITMTANLLHRFWIPLGKEVFDNFGESMTIINKSWRIYSLTQLGILGILSSEMLKTEREDNKLITNNNWLIMPGIVFLLSWYTLIVIGFAIVPEMYTRIGLINNTTFPIGDYAVESSIFHGKGSSLSAITNKTGNNNGSPYLVMKNNQPVTFTIKGRGGSELNDWKAKSAGIFMGNHRNRSEGVVEICLKTNSISEINSNRNCASINLNDTRDNAVSWVKFETKELGAWERVSINITNKYGDKYEPVLYTDESQRPLIMLYGQK